MKAQERDELLIRLDERTCNIWDLTEKQETHLIKLNDALSKHSVDIGKNKTSIMWIVRVLTAVGILGGSGAGIWRLLN